VAEAAVAVTQVAEAAVAVTQVAEAAVAESPATVEPDKKAVASEEKKTDDKPKRRRRRKKRKKRLKLETFTVGDELEGIVRSVQPYGAFIDVGAERDGLIHISELREGYVEKVEDVIKEREKVMIRVKEVNVETGRLSLTMLSPESIEAKKEPKKKRIHLRYLEEGQELVGRVNSIVDFGAFIDIGATTDGLVHISQMSEDHVSSVSDLLQEGQEVQVRILSIDKKRKRISLTMREAQVEKEDDERSKEKYRLKERPAKRINYEIEKEENEDGLPSLMAIAFARANARKQRKDKKSQQDINNKQDGNIDKIIAKMLDKHRTDQ
jgi:ribosomal protein S1